MVWSFNGRSGAAKNCNEGTQIPGSNYRLLDIPEQSLGLGSWVWERPNGRVANEL